LLRLGRAGFGARLRLEARATNLGALATTHLVEVLLAEARRRVRVRGCRSQDPIAVLLLLPFLLIVRFGAETLARLGKDRCIDALRKALGLAQLLLGLLGTSAAIEVSA
jgi:hypothetical protein